MNTKYTFSRNFELEVDKALGDKAIFDDGEVAEEHAGRIMSVPQLSPTLTITLHGLECGAAHVTA
jgi:hypothetical protein